MTGVSERSQHISNLKYEGYINQKCTAPIIDLFNNEVISCSISERPTMPMIDDILMKAFARLDAGTNPVLHSDQGWQYRHQWYQLREFGIIQSMSRKGNCLDNACADFFFRDFKIRKFLHQ
ncbi:transposase [Salmonella enterica subsp. enterica]|nr:transposase [Salmonella enterica subsp. enterica serovar Miami]